MAQLGASGCQFGDKVFSNFNYTYTVYDALGNIVPGGNGSTPNVTASQVQIVFSDLGGNPLAPVLSMLANWTAAGGYPSDITVRYDVSAGLGTPMVYSWIGITGSVTNTGNGTASFVSAGDTVNTGATQVNLGTQLSPTSPGTTTGTVTGSAYYSPVYSVAITKDVYLYAGTGTNSATVTRIDQGLTESPEPMVSLMVGGGFTLLGLLGARSRKKKNQ